MIYVHILYTKKLVLAFSFNYWVEWITEKAKHNRQNKDWKKLFLD